MLQYERFQETVLKEVGEGAVEWKHILPAVPVAHRLRFLYTLRKGFSIPAVFDMVMLSQTLADKDYDLFVQQAIATRLAGNEREGGKVEKFSIND
ncbi:MAG: hypothetical protein H3C54_10590 [Taibaiella sp.]|nr:hypothetical protein [Taibaiella sp.]